jgi:hypothetical protein
LSWALALRGVLGIGLFIIALKLGLERPVRPMLRLLALPCLALIAARLSAFLVLRAATGLDLPAQLVLAVSVSISMGSFALVVLLAAPQRMVDMTARLHRALRGAPVV